MSACMYLLHALDVMQGGHALPPFLAISMSLVKRYVCPGSTGCDTPQTKFDEAESLCERARSIGVTALGPRHASVATILNTQASLRNAQVTLCGSFYTDTRSTRQAHHALVGCRPKMHGEHIV